MHFERDWPFKMHKIIIFSRNPELIKILGLTSEELHALFKGVFWPLYEAKK